MDRMNREDVVALQGETMFDVDGTKIGKIGDVYVDNDTQVPEWALVVTGLFGGRQSFVPLAEATRSDGGLRVPYTKEEVREAPNAEPDQELSQEAEARLYSHYGLHSESASGSGGPTMIRSEERLNVRVQRRPSETVRLRKVVVTENVTQTVPVRHEELVIERVPVTDGAVVSGDPIVEQDFEIVLHAERPVMAKETVAVERIHVGTKLVTENVQVQDEVRKEQVELTEQGADGVPMPDTRGN